MANLTIVASSVRNKHGVERILMTVSDALGSNARTAFKELNYGIA